MTQRAHEVTIAALIGSFRAFLTVLVDTAGQPLALPSHLLLWATLIETERRLVLRAPRGHGKTTLLLAYALWWAWRHNRTATGWRTDSAAPTFDAVLFSATADQALDLMSRYRDLLLANARLFGELLDRRPDPHRRTRWSAEEVRLPNRAWFRVRAFRTSVRGLHPNLLLLDDVLNDQNSLFDEQRKKTYDFFMRDLMPMQADRMIAIGTAIHRDDLLAHLERDMGKGVDRQHTRLGFRVETFRALDEEAGEALWPEMLTTAELGALHDVDPVAFSREYQNDPRDDAASLFPYELTERAIEAGAGLVLGTGHPAIDPEVVVFGMDLARSASDRADFTVVVVAAWDPRAGTRRVMDIRRERGLEYRDQLELVRELVVAHRVLRGVVENNGFQQWLLDGVAKLPETAGRVVGHHTGRGKGDLRDGIPRLAHEFQNGRWIIPSGDSYSLRMARVLQSELADFGYRGGRQVSVGTHDDTVIAAWLVEVAIQLLFDQAMSLPDYEIVTAEDLGIEPVRIAEWDRW